MLQLKTVMKIYKNDKIKTIVNFEKKKPLTMGFVKGKNPSGIFGLKKVTNFEIFRDFLIEFYELFYEIC